MVAFVEEPGGKRLFAVLVLACAAAVLAGCSETAGTVTPSAAVTARSEFVDAGQPIMLTGASLAANESAADPAVAAAQPQGAGTTSAATAEAPRMATAMVEPSSTDIATPTPAAEMVTTLPEEGTVPADTAALGGSLADPTPAAEVLADAPADKDISASAKAKLIGELKALKARPGVAPAASGGDNEACPQGSLEPQCLAAAD